jgi:5-methylcytosine-specific restriction endonuclease McrA
MRLCAVCGESFTQSRLGRPRLYCSLRCKNATPAQLAARKVRGARYRDREDRRQQARQRTADWRTYDPERAKDSNRSDYERFRPNRLAAAATYREANREKIREAARAYGRAHPDVVWRSDANRRARERDAFIETIDRTVLYDRDHGECGLCRRHVDWADASVDHVIPLSKGGLHSYANTQIAHLVCNLKRGNRGPAQVRMFG